MVRFVWVSLIFSVLTLHSMSVEPVQEIDKNLVNDKLEALVLEYGAGKEVPAALKATFFTALSYYPELKNVDIKVRFKNIKTTMQCRPRWDFFLHKKSKRSYIIYVDNQIKNDYGVLFSELTLNAQVGVLGHELAHVVDYNAMNNLGIVKFGLNYLNMSKRKDIEHGIDLIAIEKGLGYQINDFSKYVFEDSGASVEYLKYKLKFYFKPFQIKNLIAQYPIYNTDDVLVD